MRKILPALLVLACQVNPLALAASGAEKIEFSRDIRPILSDKCFQCHGPDEANREAGLRLDVRDSAVSMGAIEPDDADASQLLGRVLSDDPDAVMPPPSTQKSITNDEAELLRRWIGEGAEYEEHWAFTPPLRPEPPTIANPEWARNPIDHFVSSRHTEHQLEPSPPADRVTLIRRLYLDLIGLPPEPHEVEAFQRDASETAYQSMVERLLQSPHFGERWARWWLDAARYADSDGYEKDKPRNVWFYRDWVIDAMNQDRPYDEFIIEQIAGDLMPETGQSGLVATGFLRNSMVNEEGGADPEQFRVEGMFDRIDAIGKAILGITTQCAQCHTHKYDPLSQREYYQMFAALNDFHEATATVFTPEQQQLRGRLLSEISAVEQDLKQSHPDWQRRLAEWSEEASTRLVDWQTVTPTDMPYEGQKFRLLDDGSIISESYAPTRATNTFSGPVSAGTITAIRLDALTHPQLPRGGPGRSIYGTGALSEFSLKVSSLDNPSDSRTIKLVRAMSDVNPPKSDLPRKYRDRDPSKDDRVTGPIDFAIDDDPKTAWTTDIGPGRRNQDRHAIFVPEQPIVLEEESTLSFTLRQLHGGWNSDDNQNYLLGRYRFSITDSESVGERTMPSVVQSVLAVPTSERSDQQWQTLFEFWRTTVDEFAEFNERIEALWEQFPESDSQLVARSMGSPRETFVFKRGNFLDPGPRVSPGTPEFLNPMPSSDQPPRLRFARWLVDDDAPTTARVIVNRIWQSYFGRGIVTTPEDFGFQSEPPTHPGLLDWLAVELMENNWSLKHIHQLIVTSATYRQSSRISNEMAEVDPYNRWLARGPRFRVDAELVRDIALAASGLLEETVGGPSIYPPAPEFLFLPPASYGPKQWNRSADGDQYRRSLYVHRYRSVAYPPLQVFDAPKGDAACVRRQRSNTPLQALVLLNETQFVECARAMAGRVIREGGTSDSERLKFAFQLATSRQPDSDEILVLDQLLSQQRRRSIAGEIDIESLVGTPPEMYRQLTGTSATEFAPWIVVCRAILNLDETITKP